MGTAKNSDEHHISNKHAFNDNDDDDDASMINVRERGDDSPDDPLSYLETFDDDEEWWIVQYGYGAQFGCCRPRRDRRTGSFSKTELIRAQRAKTTWANVALTWSCVYFALQIACFTYVWVECPSPYGWFYFTRWGLFAVFLDSLFELTSKSLVRFKWFKTPESALMSSRRDLRLRWCGKYGIVKTTREFFLIAFTWTFWIWLLYNFFGGSDRVYTPQSVLAHLVPPVCCFVNFFVTDIHWPLAWAARAPTFLLLYEVMSVAQWYNRAGHLTEATCTVIYTPPYIIYTEVNWNLAKTAWLPLMTIFTAKYFSLFTWFCTAMASWTESRSSGGSKCCCCRSRK